MPDDRRLYPRPLLTPPRRWTERPEATTVFLDECTCPPSERRGPTGGVCGRCAGAIPGVGERPIIAR